MQRNNTVTLCTLPNIFVVSKIPMLRCVWPPLDNLGSTPVFICSTSMRFKSISFDNESVESVRWKLSLR